LPLLSAADAPAFVTGGTVGAGAALPYESSETVWCAVVLSLVSLLLYHDKVPDSTWTDLMMWRFILLGSPIVTSALLDLPVFRFGKDLVRIARVSKWRPLCFK
jgi:hypothetical protein